MVAGFVRPTQGKVFLDDLDLTNLPAYQRARTAVYLPQDSSVFQKLTVEENVRAIVETLGLSKAKEIEMVEERLAELRLSDLANQKAYTLSGGSADGLKLQSTCSETKIFDA